MKSQILILKVNYDDDGIKPSNWNWSNLIGCDQDCVEVVNYGVVEAVENND